MHVQLTEMSAKRLVFSRGNGLITKNQHLPLQKGAFHLRDLDVVQLKGQVETADLGAHMGSQRF